MRSECARIADQLDQAFTGDAWHGDPLRKILSGVTPEQADARPLPSAHPIWEIAVHVHLYLRSAIEALNGTPMPRWHGTEADWPRISDTSPEAWGKTTRRLFEDAASLARTMQQQSDTTLTETVPGRDYDFYFLIHGIVQHSLYHGGQIALLKKALSFRGQQH